MTNWSELEHAYGSAEDVPDLLAEASQGNQRAVEVLSNCIAHQGWASCEVATVVAPLLWDAGVKSDKKARAALALLLADLACLGSHEHFLGGLHADEMLAGMLADEPYAGLRAAVLERRELGLEWLEDADPGVRSAAAVLVAVTQPDGGAEVLARRLDKERSRAPKADLAAAMGWFADADLAPIHELFAKNKPESFGAAVALAMHGELNAEVATALVAPEPIKGSAWCDGEVGRHGVGVLVATARGAGQDKLLFDAMQSIPEEIDYGKVAALLVKNAFPKEVEAHRHGRSKDLPTPPLETLTDAQRELLDGLSQTDRGWWHNDMTFWLEYLGFWKEPVSTREYLGYEPEPTVLDLEVEVDGEQTTIRDWLVPKMVEGADVSPLVGPALDFVGDRFPELSRHFWRCTTEDSFASRSFSLQLLVAANRLDLVTEALEHYGEVGIPTMWTEKRFRRTEAGFVRHLVFTLLLAGEPIPASSPGSGHRQGALLGVGAALRRAGERLGRDPSQVVIVCVWFHDARCSNRAEYTKVRRTGQ